MVVFTLSRVPTPDVAWAPLDRGRAREIVLEPPRGGRPSPILPMKTRSEFRRL